MAIFEIAKNEFCSKNFFREIDLFDFMSFLVWSFLNFLADCELFIIKNHLKKYNINISEIFSVFLPGYEEISTTKEYLNQNNSVMVCQLHSQMASKEQRKAFQKFYPKRKVILATNIAETSLTIDDVRIVIDCGKIILYI